MRAMRISKKNVQELFKLLIAKIGGRVATSPNDHGAFILNYHADYGGYIIERIDDKTTGVDQPFGLDRRSAQVMWWSMHFAMRTFEVQQTLAKVPS